MMKRKQARGLAEALDRDGKTHVGEYPADKSDDELKAKNFTNHV